MRAIVVVLSLLALSCSFFSSTTAIPKHHQKRSIAQELCPKNTTYEECVAYAKAQSNTLTYCHRFIGGYGSIEWQSCGTIKCGENSKLIAQDLSKPYPECCETCEILDPSKPLEYTRSI
ncbi:uncharacterized protein LOC131668384 [Phymastichus coffea]|uniref:uncharacterized protein LOC131668384 n=1 Tax=Phymastichus coffea TaxID=108790 RepID=UPI00273C9874|nr:uncharacterized protein LOC131668384 [Phymastichus coffea]